MTEIATPGERKNLNEWLGVPSHDELSACVSCGICLPKCPTFQILGVETASPRGRAALIRSAADGRLPLGAGLEEHMYLCLNCQACHTACPNGVRVGEMVERTRTELRRNTPTPLLRRMVHRLVLGWLLGRHWRVELAAGLLRLYQRLGLGALVRWLGGRGLLPAGLAAKEALLPILPRRFLRREIPLVTPAKGERRGAVGIFLGCVMNTLYRRRHPRHHPRPGRERLRRGGAQGPALLRRPPPRRGGGGDGARSHAAQRSHLRRIRG